MVVDTDVLIWYMRGNKKAKDLLESLSSISISAITQMELIQGIRNKKELQSLRRFIRDWNIEVIMVNETISNRALFYMEEHFLRSNLRMADSLIAATSAITGQPLATGNTKHYISIKDITIKKFTH